jgi:formamidopyrimidine-DNA glycosylase
VPELPEVETVVRSIRPRVSGQRILHAEVNSQRVTRGGFAETLAGLAGARIETVRRQGKQIYFDLNKGVLYVHLGMTGQLLWNGDRRKYARAVLELENGTLIFDDVRQFGRFEFFPEAPELVTRIGPDALAVEFSDFYQRLQRHRGFIKPVLLNQTFISGVGNIYADEALFASQIHPRAVAKKLSKPRARKLYENLREILLEAVRHRGSSISNYVDSNGVRGEYQQHHSAYGRAGEACVRCGKTIRRVVLGQRGTHYCPGCQYV